MTVSVGFTKKDFSGSSSIYHDAVYGLLLGSATFFIHPLDIKNPNPSDNGSSKSYAMQLFSSHTAADEAMDSGSCRLKTVHHANQADRERLFQLTIVESLIPNREGAYSFFLDFLCCLAYLCADA